MIFPCICPPPSPPDSPRSVEGTPGVTATLGVSHLEPPPDPPAAAQRPAPPAVAPAPATVAAAAAAPAPLRPIPPIPVTIPASPAVAQAPAAAAAAAQRPAAPAAVAAVAAAAAAPAASPAAQAPAQRPVAAPPNLSPEARSYLTAIRYTHCLAEYARLHRENPNQYVDPACIDRILTAMGNSHYTRSDQDKLFVKLGLIKLFSTPNITPFLKNIIVLQSPPSRLVESSYYRADHLVTDNDYLVTWAHQLGDRESLTTTGIEFSSHREIERLSDHSFIIQSHIKLNLNPSLEGSNSSLTFPQPFHLHLNETEIIEFETSFSNITRRLPLFIWPQPAPAPAAPVAPATTAAPAAAPAAAAPAAAASPAAPVAPPTPAAATAAAPAAAASPAAPAPAAATAAAPAATTPAPAAPAPSANEIESLRSEFYQLLANELRQIPGFSGLGTQSLSQSVDIQHTGNSSQGMSEWAISYHLNQDTHHTLAKWAICYAVQSFINHVTNQSVELGFNSSRNISHSDFKKILDTLKNPDYTDAKLKLQFIAAEYLSDARELCTGFKSWREVLEAETVLRKQGKPGRLSDAVYDHLRTHFPVEPSANPAGFRDNQTQSVVPLLHTALLDLEKSPNRDVWKAYLLALFINRDFKDNKGNLKEFLTGREEWRTILNESQAREVCKDTDLILAVAKKLSYMIGDPNPDIIFLRDALLVNGSENEMNPIEGIMQTYIEQLGLSYIPHEPLDQLVMRFFKKEAVELHPQPMPRMREESTSTSSPTWLDSFRELETMLSAERNPELAAALTALRTELGQHPDNPDIAPLLHTLVSKLKSISEHHARRYPSVLTTVKEQIKAFNDVSDHSSFAGRSDISDACASGVVGRILALIKSVTMADNLKEFVANHLKEQLRIKLSADMGVMGGIAETSMHDTFIESFLALKGWCRPLRAPIPYAEYRDNFNLITTRNWNNHPWVVQCILKAVYDYYESKITSALSEQNSLGTTPIDEIVSILRDINPQFVATELDTMFYPTSDIEDMTINKSALLLFIMEHVSEIAKREGYIGQFPTLPIP